LTVTHQPFELKSCSNPLQMGKVLQFRIKKKNSVWVVYISGDVYVSTGSFDMFSQVCQNIC